MNLSGLQKCPCVRAQRSPGKLWRAALKTSIIFSESKFTLPKKLQRVILMTAIDIAIIGGGAAGCSTAYFLAKSGVKVALIEKDGIASQASGFSAGVLNPLEGAGIPGPLAPLALQSFLIHKKLWGELEEESKIEFHAKDQSMIRVAYEESDMPELRKALKAFNAAEGFAAELLSPTELNRLVPRLTPKLVGGLQTFGAATLDSYSYTIALWKIAERHGAIMINDTVTNILTSSDKVTSVRLAKSEIYCDTVVIALGPWSRIVEKWLATPIPVRPLKGEILRTRPTRKYDPLTYDISSLEITLYQRWDDLVWIGATEEECGFNKEPNKIARRNLLRGAAELLPDMHGATVVKHTACLRPITIDGLPLIGRLHPWKNAYIATGAGKKGILISPGIGKATSDLILRDKTELAISNMTPTRFGQKR